MAENIRVDVVYALPDVQKVINIEISPETTVLEAIKQSSIVDYFPEIDPDRAKAGVYNRAVKLADTLRDGDRIEIYRPLIADPKTARLRRAEKAKEEGRADKVTGGRLNPQRAENKAS